MCTALPSPALCFEYTRARFFVKRKKRLRRCQALIGQGSTEPLVGRLQGLEKSARRLVDSPCYTAIVHKKGEVNRACRPLRLLERQADHIFHFPLKQNGNSVHTVAYRIATDCSLNGYYESLEMMRRAGLGGDILGTHICSELAGGAEELHRGKVSKVLEHLGHPLALPRSLHRGIKREMSSVVNYVHPAAHRRGGKEIGINFRDIRAVDIPSLGKSKRNAVSRKDRRRVRPSGPAFLKLMRLCITDNKKNRQKRKERDEKELTRLLSHSGTSSRVSRAEHLSLLLS